MTTATNSEVTGQIVYNTESVQGIIKDTITTVCDQAEGISAQGIKTASFSLIPTLFSLFSSALEYLGLAGPVAAPVAGLAAERVTAAAGPVVDASVNAACSATKCVLHKSVDVSADCSNRSWRWFF